MRFMNILFFLNQIVRIVFEPFFVLMLLGFITALVINWKQRDRLFYTLLTGIVIIFSWRLCVNLLSKRYSAIMIIVAVGFSAYFIFMLPIYQSCLLSRFFKEKLGNIGRFLRNYSRLSSRFLLLILIIVCCCKLSLYNRFSNTIPRMCDVVLKDSKKYKTSLFVDFSKESPRIFYYLKRPIIQTVHSRDINLKFEKLRQILQCNQDVTYVFFRVNRHNNILKELEKINDGKWELLFSSPCNNRKKTYFYVYKSVNKR